jgi:hypothetical protein
MGLVKPPHHPSGLKQGCGISLNNSDPTIQHGLGQETDGCAELTEDLIDKIASQSDARSGHHAVRELEHTRDANLGDDDAPLGARAIGAGAILNLHDKTMDRPARSQRDVGGRGRPEPGC